MICYICGHWARVGGLESEHHPHCPLLSRSPTEAEVLRLLRRLCDGIRRWAADEDGVPDYLADDYEAAVSLLFVGCV